jgi:nitrogen fixation protein NifB
MLGEATNQELVDLLHACAVGESADRPYVAVASAEGLLVNLHLGEADELMVFDRDGRQVATRVTPRAGLGVQRWLDLAAVLPDCRAVLVSGAGETPRQVLAEAGVKVYITEGLVADALEAVYHGRSFAPPRREFRCGEACAGQGNGCG